MIHSKHRMGGFTIVELLVVIVVIGIIAGITIVSYTAITNNAKKQTAKTDAQTMAAQLTKYKSENGTFPADLSSLSNTLSVDSTFQYTYDSTAGTYCLTASVEGASAYVRSGNSNAQEGGCAGHGVNGQQPITNLASDPAATSYATSNALAGWRNDRWTADGTYSLQTGAGDGPVAGLTTYARFQFTAAVAGGRGFHITGNPEAGSPAAGVGLAVEAGKTYTLSAYMRSTRTSGGSVSVAVGVRFVNGSNAWMSTTTNGSAVTAAAGSPTTNPGPWVRPTLTVTAPSGAVRMQIYIRETAAPTHIAGDRIEGTGLLITEGSSLYGYASGATAGWVWNGTANASTSTGPAL